MKGLGEEAAFASFHPLVNVLYFTFAIGITMFCMSVYFLAVTCIMAWLYSILLGGSETLKFNLMFFSSILLFSFGINTLFVHSGKTILFYLGAFPITGEAMVFGATSGLLLASVTIWFSCFNVIMTSEKLIYLFGRIAPVLGLTLSMTFRFIPLLKARFAEVSMGQKCLGRTYYQQKRIARIRQLAKELSILTAWSLETFIETADSMEARGYGLKGRTTFSLYRFTKRDLIVLVVMVALMIPVVVALICGKISMKFYPMVQIPPLDLPMGCVLVCFAGLLAVPICIDIFGELSWKQFSLNM